jgi:putative aldouronate transport system substrate-binding protein
MRTLYRDGFIVPDSFTMNGDQARSVWDATNPQAAILANSWMNGYSLQGSERWINTFVLPALQGPGGQRNAPNQEPWSILYGKVFMTDKLKNPELLYALYDYFITFDVTMDGYMGPKGSAWTDPDPGTSSLAGNTPLYKLLITFGNQALNSSWDQAHPMIRSSAFRLGEQATNTREAEQWLNNHLNDPTIMNTLRADNSYAEQMWYRTSLANSKYAMPASVFIPPIGMEDADNQRYSDIYAVLNPYLDKAFAEFITGVRDPNNDAHWNAYLAELDSMNAPELIRILQKYIR